MKIAPLAEVKDRLDAYVDAAKESAIVVTTNDRWFVRLLTQARERVQSGQYLNNKQLWQELRRRGTRRSVRKAKAATRGR